MVSARRMRQSLTRLSTISSEGRTAMVAALTSSALTPGPPSARPRTKATSSSIRGAFYGALLAGLIDTLLRAFLPGLLRQVMAGSNADALGAGLSSMGVYLLMAIVLLVRPKGLFVKQS